MFRHLGKWIDVINWATAAAAQAEKRHRYSYLASPPTDKHDALTQVVLSEVPAVVAKEMQGPPSHLGYA